MAASPTTSARPGTVPEQVIKIAEAIRGNTLNLPMVASGCHVVQKAFDSVPEEYKAINVRETSSSYSRDRSRSAQEKEKRRRIREQSRHSR